MSYVVYSLIGLAAGLLAGIFGVGGGIIVVPALVFAAGMTQQTASATSLVALLLPVGFLGVREYYRAGKLSPESISAGLIIAAGLFVGAYFGSRLALSLPEATLRKGFAIFLVLVAMKLWFGK